MLAILEDAVTTLVGNVGSADPHRLRLFNETAEWLDADDDEWLVSVTDVCHALRLDAGELRRWVSERLAERWAPRSGGPVGTESRASS
jgi:hypothetical protein